MLVLIHGDHEGVFGTLGVAVEDPLFQSVAFGGGRCEGRRGARFIGAGAGEGGCLLGLGRCHQLQTADAEGGVGVLLEGFHIAHIVHAHRVECILCVGKLLHLGGVGGAVGAGQLVGAAVGGVV